MFFPPSHPLLPLPDDGLSIPGITIHYKNVSACPRSIHPASACSSQEKTKIDTLFLAKLHSQETEGACAAGQRNCSARSLTPLATIFLKCTAGTGQS